MYSKGKIHPCLESPSSAPKFLPPTIITLSIALPPEDQEVLFYLIACSLNVFSYQDQSQGGNKGSSSRRGGGGRKNGSNSSTGASPHGLSFECSCFECYMSFWSRWNGSPNRDLIHKAIEIFEDHMAVKTGKKMKAREEKSQAKQLITWLESNGGICGKERGLLLHKEDSDDGEAIMACDDGGQKNSGGPTRMKEYMHTKSGSERTFMRRMLPGFVGLLTGNLWPVWSPLDPCKA